MERITEVIVLAGGFGTRLRSEIGDIPKPLAPVNDQPFLSHLFDYLIESNIERVILSVGYKWDLLVETYGDFYQDLELIYVVEEEPLGTGGGIRLALEQLQSDVCFVMNGDTLFTIPLGDLEEFHWLNEADCTLALKPMYEVDRYGHVELEEGKIMRFEEKSFREEAWINGGIYCINKAAFEEIAPGTSFSFEKQYLEDDPQEKELFALPFDDYFIDIGVPEDYHKFIEDTQL